MKRIAVAVILKNFKAIFFPAYVTNSNICFMGVDDYMNYKMATGSGSGNGGSRSPSGCGSGCLTIIIIAILICTTIALLFK
jgi:hypothetical protein